MFTKQHYEAIAKIIKDTTYINPQKFELYIKKEDFIAQLSKYFHEDNPNFNAFRFQQACEILG